MKYTSLLFIVLLTLGLSACGDKAATGDEHGHNEAAEADEHGHGEVAAEAEPVKGEHGGRLLEQNGYALELKIHEDGVPPEYRVWLYRDKKPLAPSAGQVKVHLTRLGNINDIHSFKVENDYLKSDAEVYEPHSFVVEVIANIDGKAVRWNFDSFEGRTKIESGIAEKSGIKTSKVTTGMIREEHEVQGLLTPIEGKHARVMARFPGPVRSVNVSVGDRVRAGQILAVIESNISLSNYNVTAPFSGTVLSRNVAAGDLAADQALFEIADLSKLWVDLHLFGADAQNIRPGLPVQVIRLTDNVSIDTQIDRVLPGTATASQSTVARAIIENTDGQWRPGAAVRANVAITEKPVAMWVPLSALQKFRDWDVVFIRSGDEYEIRPLTLGQRDAKNIEVLEGLKVGEEIVTEQSYLVKADIEKSGASHDH
jgi:cobalt-zinc-cadmium efflux system membrane fusion protein